MAKVRIALVPTSGPAAGRYRLQLFPGESRTYDEFVEYCLSTASLTGPDVDKVIRLAGEWIQQCEAAGETCSLGDLGRSRLSAKGVYDLPAQDFRELDFDYNLTWLVSAPLKKKIRQEAKSLLKERVHVDHLPIVMSVQTVAPQFDSAHRVENAWHRGRSMFITGDRLKFNRERLDEGIFFRPESSKQDFTRAVTYGPISLKQLSCNVPDELQGSGYLRLQVRRRHLPHDDELLMTEYKYRLKEI